MFLYPLSQMTGGVFYEHAHRLMGAFVGLSSIFLMVMSIASARGALVKIAAAAAFVLICIQGVMGGLRVTAESVVLAILHGINGHIVLSILALATLFSTQLWANARSEPSEHAGKTKQFAIIALVIVFVQIAFGVVARHFPDTLHGVMSHAGFSIVAASAAVMAGSVAAKNASHPLLKKLGKASLHTVGLQMALGVAALGIVMTMRDQDTPHTLDLILTTTHQIVGALLLAILTLVVVLTQRTMRQA